MPARKGFVPIAPLLAVRRPPKMEKDRYGGDHNDRSSYKEVPGGGRLAPQRRKDMFVSFTLLVMKKWSLTVTIFF